NYQLKEQPKNIKQVLKECNLWPIKSICLMYKQYFGKCDEVNSEKLDCCI
ncbi:16920_t:CDS:1, partial [Funneliformis caledonium]